MWAAPAAAVARQAQRGVTATLPDYAAQKQGRLLRGSDTACYEAAAPLGAQRRPGRVTEP